MTSRATFAAATLLVAGIAGFAWTQLVPPRGPSTPSVVRWATEGTPGFKAGAPAAMNLEVVAGSRGLRKGAELRIGYPHWGLWSARGRSTPGCGELRFRPLVRGASAPGANSPLRSHLHSSPSDAGSQKRRTSLRSDGLAGLESARRTRAGRHRARGARTPDRGRTQLCYPWQRIRSRRAAGRPLGQPRGNCTDPATCGRHRRARDPSGRASRRVRGRNLHRDIQPLLGRRRCPADRLGRPTRALRPLRRSGNAGGVVHPTPARPPSWTERLFRTMTGS